MYCSGCLRLDYKIVCHADAVCPVGLSSKRSAVVELFLWRGRRTTRLSSSLVPFASNREAQCLYIRSYYTYKMRAREDSYCLLETIARLRRNSLPAFTKHINEDMQSLYPTDIRCLNLSRWVRSSSDLFVCSCMVAGRNGQSPLIYGRMCVVRYHRLVWFSSNEGFNRHAMNPGADRQSMTRDFDF
jgi:hypothetical protein